MVLCPGPEPIRRDLVQALVREPEKIGFGVWGSVKIIESTMFQAVGSRWEGGIMGHSSALGLSHRV